jgi:RNA polymerase sigma factor (sigma-70 family)
LHDALKHFHRDKRDIARERSLEPDLNRSASGMADWLAGNFTSPSHRAAQNEQMLRLADALAELPENMREVVVLKHCQGWTLKQISERMNKSVASIASCCDAG